MAEDEGTAPSGEDPDCQVVSAFPWGALGLWKSNSEVPPGAMVSLGLRKGWPLGATGRPAHSRPVGGTPCESALPGGQRKLERRLGQAGTDSHAHAGGFGPYPVLGEGQALLVR